MFWAGRPKRHAGRVRSPSNKVELSVPQKILFSAGNAVLRVGVGAPRACIGGCAIRSGRFDGGLPQPMAGPRSAAIRQGSLSSNQVTPMQTRTNPRPPPQARLAASCAFAVLAIALGAFGAHGLEERLAATGHLDTWETAALYHLVHALALFALAAAGDRLRSRWAFPLWAVGIVVFSGSLYVLSVTGLGLLGAITPLGGLAFIAGWIALYWENRKGPSA